MKPIVQISLDLTSIEAAVKTAGMAIAAGVDWLEAGTPLIIAEGMNGVRALRQEFPQTPIVADLKTMDGGWLEAELMAKAGASHVVVMGQAHGETVELVVRAGRDLGIKVMGDNLAMPDPVAGARLLQELGCDYVIHHIGYDLRNVWRERGQEPPSPLDRLREVVQAVTVPVQAVGGLSIDQAVATPAYGAPLVVIGAPLAIDASSFKAAAGDVQAILVQICQKVHGYGDVPVGEKGEFMSARMPAIVNFALEPRSVELREVPVPTIAENEVLFRVAAASICGSDLHQWLGGISWKVNYPCILGHEFAGTIVQAGKNVSTFKEGDRVVSETAAVIDPHSPYARRGLYNLDPNRLGFGYGVNGAMTQYVKVAERCLHAIPDNLSFEKAALTEPCSVAYNAVCVNGHIRPGDQVLVLGPGPIGLLCALMAKINGAGHLVVAGLPADAKRLAVARTLGADAALDGDVLPYVRQLGDGFGMDLVIDAAGVSATFQTALSAVRPAGQIIKVGWGPQPLGSSLDPMVQKAVTVQGSFSHNWPVWERVIRMLATQQLAVEPIMSRLAGLEEWEDCFEKMHTGEYVKAILKPNG